LLAAQELIDKHGYYRRKEELADCWPLFFPDDAVPGG
jgi:hypothetical protein